MGFSTHAALWLRRLVEAGRRAHNGASWPATPEPGASEFFSPDMNFADHPEWPANETVCPKVLLVVAHPDDESECAAFLYRVTHELRGVVDQVVVTNGEAGMQYAAPVQAYYGVPLSADHGRKHLARIRRRELLRACRILGVRHNYFLDQNDTGFTFDLNAGYQAWDVVRVRQRLQALLERSEYNMVVTLLPASDTHGHHQTVALLTLEAVAQIELGKRPAVLGVRTATGQNCQHDFAELPGYPLTRTTSSAPLWTFDRRAPLGGHKALDYSIVVNWIIAEHKSQGMFQMEYGRRTTEDFWLFEVSGASGVAKWRSFMDAIPTWEVPNGGSAPAMKPLAPRLNTLTGSPAQQPDSN